MFVHQTEKLFNVYSKEIKAKRGGEGIERGRRKGERNRMRRNRCSIPNHQQSVQQPWMLGVRGGTAEAALASVWDTEDSGQRNRSSPGI